MAGSKRFKGKKCVYCRVNESTTADHVFCREFFQEHERDGLPKVPACEECNNNKSKLEHYLATLLPLTAPYSKDKTSIIKNVRRRLSRNKKISDSLYNSLVDHEDMDIPGLDSKFSSFNFDIDKLYEYCEYAARGLLWYHWGKLLSSESITISYANSEDRENISSLLRAKTEFNVDVILGDRTVEYKGVWLDINEGTSVWEFKILGKVSMFDDENNLVLKNSRIAVISGHASMLRK